MITQYKGNVRARCLVTNMCGGRPAMAIHDSFDVVVIGGGPGGYVAALRAAQLGATVGLVEEKVLGGTCLNIGCIPTKTLYKAAHLLKEIRSAAAYGITADHVSVDYSRLMSHKENVVRQLVQGIDHLLKKGNVKVIAGKAAFVDKNTLKVTAPGGEKVIGAKKVIIATGSSNALPPIPGIEGGNVIDSTQALSLPNLPKSIVVIGGGVIGCEFASIFGAMGAQVTVIEMMPHLITGLDRDCQVHLAKELRTNHIDVLLNCKVTNIEDAGDEKKVTYNCAGKTGTVSAEKILVAIGRKPNTPGLALQSAGVVTRKDWITVNSFMQTSVGHIYAIGDVIGEQMYAHAAYAEAMTAVEHALGQPRKVNYRAVPKAIFTIPEIGSVGLSEDEARQQGFKVKTAVFPLIGNGKAIIDGETGGFIKVVADETYHEILGVHMIAPHATELTGAAALAINTETSLEDIVDTIHAHPTVSEAFKEAALLALGKQLHC